MKSNSHSGRSGSTTVARISLALTCAIALGGCSTVKGWFGDKKGDDKPNEPLALTDITLPDLNARLNALSAAARGGVLFKGGAALETLATVRTFAFDKTGTLTTGRAEVARIVSPDMSEDAFVQLLAGLEAQSEHPIAAAIRREAERRGLAIKEMPDIRSLPSEGIVSGQGEAALWAGNPRLAKTMGADPEVDWLAEIRAENRTVIYLGQGPHVMGAASVADQPRLTSAAAIAALRQGGVQTIAMMTGDRRPVALRIGAELGIRPDEIHADLLPADKVDLVAQLAAGGKLAFVGDGVNDAPSLTRASVGISISNASQMAVQSAQVILMNGNLSKLLEAIDISKLTVNTLKNSIFWAFSYNIVAIPLAMGGFLNPTWGALFMAFSDLIVIGNALFLNYRKLF